MIAPSLVELERRNPNRLSIDSGKKLDVDEAQSLRGEWDSKSPVSLAIQASILD